MRIYSFPSSILNQIPQIFPYIYKCAVGWKETQKALYLFHGNNIGTSKDHLDPLVGITGYKGSRTTTCYCKSMVWYICKQGDYPLKWLKHETGETEVLLEFKAATLSTSYETCFFFLHKINMKLFTANQLLKWKNPGSVLTTTNVNLKRRDVGRGKQ